MPLFYFDIIQIDGTFKKDTVGVAMADAAAAREEAKKLIAKMSENAVNQDLSELRIEVRDADDTVLSVGAAFFDDDEVKGLPPHSIGSRQRISKQRKVYR